MVQGPGGREGRVATARTPSFTPTSHVCAGTNRGLFLGREGMGMPRTGEPTRLHFEANIARREVIEEARTPEKTEGLAFIEFGRHYFVHT